MRISENLDDCEYVYPSLTISLLRISGDIKIDDVTNGTKCAYLHAWESKGLNLPKNLY